MPRHTIQPSDIVYPLVIEQELSGSYGEGSHKTLLVRTIITQRREMIDLVDTYFVVLERGDEVAQYLTLNAAIELYNTIP